MSTRTHVIARKGRMGSYAYGLTLFLLALTGFAQMPIFKRYYIADIPGFGWLAEFYTTHFLHYLAATAILAITTYVVAEYLLVTRRYQRLSPTGVARAAILLGIIVSGILLVIRNSVFVPFSPAVVTVLLLMHMGLTMVFLLFALYCKLSCRPWTAPV
ncbi:MAG: FeS-binding protein [Desulfobacterales bacterium]|nr:FeS-binding protein [Desulfobacterales bacterium]MBS3755272.1 FeS-binding protein [Desulfobacterales bacterium]